MRRGRIKVCLTPPIVPTKVFIRPMIISTILLLIKFINMIRGGIFCQVKSMRKMLGGKCLVRETIHWWQGALPTLVRMAIKQMYWV